MLSSDLKADLERSFDPGENPVEQADKKPAEKQVTPKQEDKMVARSNWAATPDSDNGLDLLEPKSQRLRLPINDINSPFG